MRLTHRMHLLIAALLVLATGRLHASEGRGLLEGQPAVRHRAELRDKRFEIGPSFAFSIDGAVRHTLLFGAKAQYHIFDWLAVGTDVGFGVGMDSGLASEVASQYQGSDAQKEQWQTLHDRFSNIALAGDLRAVFTPFAGKLGLFSTAFLSYDVYLFGGLAFAKLKNNTSAAQETDPAFAGIDEANEGFRAGIAWGAGVRLFFGRFMALGIEIRDLMFSDNPTGGDLTRGLTSTELAGGGLPIVDGEDTSFMNHFFLGFTYTFFFPTSPRISP